MLAPDRMQKMEAQARERCLGALGDVVAEIGMQRALADYSRPEILRLVQAIVTSYQVAMRQVGEETLAIERAHFAAQGLTHPDDEAPF